MESKCLRQGPWRGTGVGGDGAQNSRNLSGPDFLKSVEQSPVEISSLLPPYQPYTHHLSVLNNPWIGPYRGGGGPCILLPVSVTCVTLAGGTSMGFPFLYGLLCGHRKNGRRNQKSVEAKD